ncbi:MAG: hypothetical protein GXX82_09700 [Syntrophorhabdus sp.]|nr:hypothetical protein [Syntrophorhabdus sp.]
MRKCADIEDRFTAYLDGYLDTAEREVIEEHLSTCPDCLRKLRELESARAILAGLDEVDPPPGLTEKIMARIHEEGRVKAGFFRRLFFPLHIKVPVQALATVFVVVLAVYVFRSTLPETTNLERPSAAPPAVETVPHPPKKEATPGTRKEAPVERAPETSTPKPAPAPAQTLKKEQAAPAAASVPETAAQASPPARAYRAAPHDGAAAEKSSSLERHTDDAMPSVKAAPPPAQGRLKTRGTAVMEEKKDWAADSAPMAPARTASPDVRSRVAMVSKDPRQTAIQAKAIMRSLGATRIEESTADNVATVSGWIETAALRELVARLKEIAPVDEPMSSLLSGPKSSFVEITIRNDNTVKPTDR